MVRRTRSNRKPSTRLILTSEECSEALRLADRLDVPVNARAAKRVSLSRTERQFLAGLLREVVNSSLLARPRSRQSKHAERDHWVAIDFHTRPMGHREKHVATDWNLAPRQVATIASRHRKQAAHLISVMGADALRALVQMHCALHRARLLRKARAN